jgi:hypothetical protein
VAATPASSVAAKTSVASAVSQQTIASLQAQMAHYSPSANGQNSQATADYRALQAAIKSGNVSDAQASLARLQRDSKTASPAETSRTTTSSITNPTEESAGEGIAESAQPRNERGLDVTA